MNKNTLAKGTKFAVRFFGKLAVTYFVNTLVMKVFDQTFPNDLNDD